MSSSALSQPVSQPEGAAARPEAGGRHPAIAAGLSALLLWATFPPMRWSWFAWVALVPLFLMIRSPRKPAAVYFGAWVGGMIFWTLALQWVRLSDESAWLGWLTMALMLSFYWPAFLWLARLAVNRLGLPVVVAAPIVWVGLEYSRAYFLTGFPWYYLAHGQGELLPLIQVADVTGALGVSFLIALVNAWVVDLLTLPLLRVSPRGARLTPPQLLRLAIVGGAFGLTFLYGTYRITSAHFRDGPRVALLQTSLVQRLKDGKDPEELFHLYERLIARALQADPPPDLIVWPETAYPWGMVCVGDDLDDATIERQLKDHHVKLTVKERREQRVLILQQLHALTDLIQTPMLVGALTQRHEKSGFAKYNSAVLFQPGSKDFQIFDKWHLVPFGEYVPLIETFPWLTVFTPYHDGHVPHLNFGAKPTVLTLGRYRLATVICFEDTVPQVVQRFFRGPDSGPPPDALVNLSNDGWFARLYPDNSQIASSEHDMHLAISVFRAIEHRIPLARAANTGISAIIDGNGRIRAALPAAKEDVLIGVLPLDDRNTLYSAWGDWFGQGCLAISLGWVLLAYLHPLSGRC